MKAFPRTTTAVLAALLLALCLAGPAPAGERRHDTLYQLSTLEALLAGLYQGSADFASLAQKGDTGLGTFDALDGEMVAVDGAFYQVRADGSVSRVRPDQTSPFANLVWLRADRTIQLSGVKGLDGLERALAAALPGRNLICAIKISGSFGRVKARSVPAQKMPYPPLIEVVKHQSVWTWQKQTGDVVGFYFPPYLKGVNVSGFHLHFISADRTRGGHLLDIAVDKASAKVDVLYAMDLQLPHGEAFRNLRLGADVHKAVHKVER